MTQMMTFTRFSILVFMIVLLFGGISRADVDFDRLNGADLGMGVGARAIGMAGAFTAVADDATAFFWNPAGLTQIEDHQLFLAADIPADFGAAALIYKPKGEWLRRHGFTIGLGLVDRLSFKGDSGDSTWEGYPSHLLDISMIDIDPTFSGRINSRTYDAWLSVAFQMPGLRKLSETEPNLTQVIRGA